MQFQTYLKESKAQIDTSLEEILADWEKEINDKTPKLTAVLSEFIKQCMAGKRVRGALVLLGYALTGDDGNKRNILSAACSFEIFQTAILGHDDVIDQSQIRRHQASLYSALGGDRQAESVAICLSDLGFFKSTQLLSQSGFPPVILQKAISYFEQVKQETALGEILDIYLPHQSTVTEKEILTIAALKTAQYTVTGPLSLGAMLGGADKTVLSLIKEIGENLGIAFQIHDDILGVFGEEEKLGKPTTSDISEGKATLLLYHALNSASDTDREVLERLYGRKTVIKSDVEKIKEIFMRSGAFDYAKSQENTYSEKASQQIQKLHVNKNIIVLLQDMVTYLKG